jgi:type I restriction enzyme M protein
MSINEFTADTKKLIDSLKSVCANYGLGNAGSEFDIITQIFLYKFLNDKFGYEVKSLRPDLANAEQWEEVISGYSDNDYELLLAELNPNTARLKKEHLLSYIFNNQNIGEFGKFLDDTLLDIALFNNDIFSVKTDTGAKVILFDKISTSIKDETKASNFCKALINPLVNFSFEQVFSQKFDFFSTIFEYLIKDYNNDSGGDYAEYYTPHSVSSIIASILVDKEVSNVTCYDPSAGSGTLLMNLAHQIGEDRCTIYSQDISHKSTAMLRLNLILNNLVHSIQNIIQGNTIKEPYHKQGDTLKTFDFIVSNPPFKMDFSDYVNDLDTKENNERFFAGLPNVPNKDKKKMAIYPLFIQHIMYSMSPNGKAAIVVPTGFITAQSGIEKKIRERLIEQKMLRGVVSMPSNIFATTGTNVSILFLDKANTKGDIVLMDASKLGSKVKEGKNQKTLLSFEEEERIIKTFNSHQAVEDFSVVVSYEQIKEKNYSFSAGQYFDVKIEYIDISPEEFEAKMSSFKTNLDSLFAESRLLQLEIQKQLSGLKYE